jgi:hypothetical protein
MAILVIVSLMQCNKTKKNKKKDIFSKVHGHQGQQTNETWVHGTNHWGGGCGDIFPLLL